MPHLAWLYIGEKFLRKAIANNARLLAVETIVPDTSAAAFSKLLDINMMKIEFQALLDAADFKLTRIIPTVAPQSIIEARPK